MTDHADTIRRDPEQMRLRAMSQVSHFAATSSGSGITTHCDRCHKPVNRWSEPCDYEQTSAALLAEDVLALLAERQQAIDERDRANEAFTAQADLRYKAEARCEQAIDALREAKKLLAHHSGDSPRTHAKTAYESVSAALVSLGEKP